MADQSMKEALKAPDDVVHLELKVTFSEDLAGLSELGKLETLHLDSNPGIDLTEFPALPNLTSLTMRSSKIGAWPAGIFRCKKLALLALSFNPLGSPPEALGSLTHLIVLEARRCEISDLPKSLGKLKKLKELLISKNRLRALPASLGKLKKLERLVMNHNQLDMLPGLVGMLPKLTELSANHNRIDALPPNFGALANARRIDLLANPIERFVEDMRGLKALEWLGVTPTGGLAMLKEQIRHLPPKARVTAEEEPFATAGHWQDAAAPLAKPKGAQCVTIDFDGEVYAGCRSTAAWSPTVTMARKRSR